MRALEYAKRLPYAPIAPPCDLGPKRFREGVRLGDVRLGDGICVVRTREGRRSESGVYECPMFSLVRRKETEIVAVELGLVGDGAMSDVGSCCLGRLGATKDGHVVLSGFGRVCDGGSAKLDLFEVYVLEGTTLRRIFDGTLDLH